MKRFLILVCSAVLLIGAAAWAEQDYRGYGRPHSSYYGTNPNLTPDQQKKLADLEAKYAPKIYSIDDQIAQKNRELNRFSAARHPNTKAIDRVRDDIVKLQNKRSDVVLDYQNKARDILTGDRRKPNPNAFYGPGTYPYGGGGGGYGYAPGRMMGGRGPGWGRGMMDGRGWGSRW